MRCSRYIIAQLAGDVNATWPQNTPHPHLPLASVLKTPSPSLGPFSPTQSKCPAMSIASCPYHGLACPSPDIGTVKLNVLPCPGSLSTHTLPPWASTKLLTMARPMPAPPASTDSEFSLR